MRKRIAWPTMLALAAILASISGGVAVAMSNSAPTITGMSPTSGPRATVVTITGTNLQHASVTWTPEGKPGASGSTSGAMRATPIRAIVSLNGTRVRFSVPAGGDVSHGIMAPAGMNSITIRTPSGSVSKLFRVTTMNTLGMRPAVTYLMPRHAAPGAKVTIYGTHLTTATAVKLGGMTAAFDVPSDTKIVATVPTRARSGNWVVTTRFGTATSGTFTVGASAS